MRVCVLASGSNGNACLVQDGALNLLVDAGLGPRRMEARLAAVGVAPAEISHLLLTHGHGDHVAGVLALLKRAPELSIHATRATTAALPPLARGHVQVLRGRESFCAGRLQITPFHVSHDAAGTVGFRIEGPAGTLGYATDLGRFGQSVLDHLRCADMLVIEANHCPRMLAGGPYPAFLKRRVAGPSGHLSNEQCRQLLEAVLHPGLRDVVLAHRSAANNSEAAVWEALAPLVDRRSGPRFSLGSRSSATPPVAIGGADAGQSEFSFAAAPRRAPAPS